MPNSKNAAATDGAAVPNQLRNHWTKPLGLVGYYWFLTFEDSAPLRSAVGECHSRLAFSQYDPTPLESLHLTVGRIGKSGELSPERIHATQAGARRELGEMNPFELTIGALRRVPAALILDVKSAGNIDKLRAKLGAGTTVAVSESDAPPLRHPPHVTVAYSNSDGIAPLEVDEAVAKVNRRLRMVRVQVSEVSMVMLHRRRAMYSWDLLERIPLGRSI
ncbi:2'-5' RNA ligase family protein [Nocardia sienata]|uniref:2'-5' RNA ligase family protein n=1 Tax=Nocardia sienata TaxID=248552 RepID=UPI0009FFEB78|nr:2'-5' RNA ligase family protein [Nocardia sienata]